MENIDPALILSPPEVEALAQRVSAGTASEHDWQRLLATARHLHALTRSLADRVHAQSELLSQRALRHGGLLIELQEMRRRLAEAKQTRT